MGFEIKYVVVPPTAFFVLEFQKKLLSYDNKYVTASVVTIVTIAGTMIASATSQSGRPSKALTNLSSRFN